MISDIIVINEGIGDWGLGPIPNPQSPIPNLQSPNQFLIYLLIFKNKIILVKYINYLN